MSPVEGVAALAARVAEIRQVVEGRAASRPSTADPSAGFAAVLAAELGASGGSGVAASLGPVLGTLASSSAGTRVPAVGAVAPAAAAPDLAPSSVRRINGDPLPAALAPYENGRVPEGALSPVGTGGHRLFAPAAQALTSLIDAAASDGVTIGITDTYRTYDTQVDLVRRKGLYSQGGLAATPGTSDHGWGLAADLRLDDRALAWMRTNAGRFGFAEDTPREPWHWAYQT
ncbi:M15 family metallopeptidase [Cellulomonas sp.]|uniref:M15 family metallopeptidase n=1 Tax=Cellulomonas sp. TaxID=40001 RepID=UPI00281186DD|nr:M15 family metallopeptidase [Cellulomonas sp.]